MAEEPLISKTIKCPICERQVPMWMANPRLYTVASRESDRHVTAYRWVHGLVTDVRPHHYKVWQCPNCLFADLAENVEREGYNAHAEVTRTTFRDISIEKRMVLDSLREMVPSGPLNLKGAIAIHLAAILVTTLPHAERQVDHSKLGRLALRLAWLFRELDGPALPVGSAEGGQVRSEALGALAEATERLDKLLQEAGENLREIQQHGKTRTEELRQGGSPEDNPYLPLGDLIEVRLQALQSEVTGLQMAVLQDQQGRSPAGAPVQEGAGSLVKELLAIAPSWPKLPRSERQSLKSALEAFQYSYQFEEEGDGVEQGMAQVNLILDILIRLGELEQALEWTSQISKYSSDTSTDLKNRLSKARATQTLSPYDSTAIHRKIAALSLTQQKAGEHRKDILRLMLERDREKIDAALERTAQLPIQERLNALREMGIHDGVLTLLSRELNPNPKENGGWFKGLFQG